MRIFYGILLTFLMGIAQAVPFKGLYEAHFAPEAASNRESALAQGLESVLVRLTGTEKVLQHPQVRSAIEQPWLYVKKYTFDEQGFMGWYDPTRCQSLLALAGYPVWGEQRPLSLVWLLEQADEAEHRIIDENINEYQSLIEAVNQQYGLVLLLPLMDLEDVAQVSAADISSTSAERLRRAAYRYGADTLVAIRLNHSAGMWTSQWYLETPQHSQILDLQNENKALLLQEGFENFARFLAQDYAVLPTRQQGTVRLSVAGITNAKQYRQIVTYLEQMDVVDSLRLESATSDRLSFSVKVHGGERALQQRIALDHHLLEKTPGTFYWVE